MLECCPPSPRARMKLAGRAVWLRGRRGVGMRRSSVASGDIKFRPCQTASPVARQTYAFAIFSHPRHRLRSDRHSFPDLMPFLLTIDSICVYKPSVKTSNDRTSSYGQLRITDELTMHCKHTKNREKQREMHLLVVGLSLPSAQTTRVGVPLKANEVHCSARTRQLRNFHAQI